MAVNLKKLAIVTTAYTGIQLTEDRAGVVAYVAKALGRDIEWGEIATAKDEIRPLIRDELFMLWGLGEIKTKEDEFPIEDSGGLVVELLLEDDVKLRLLEYASEKQITPAMVIEMMIEDRFSGMKVEV